MAAWFEARQGLFPSTQAEPGDIIFFDGIDGARNGIPDHIGIVEKIIGNRVPTIEGNCGHGVKRCTYTAGGPAIWGCARPKYEEEEDVKASEITVDMNGVKTKLVSIIYNDENYVLLRSLADA